MIRGNMSESILCMCVCVCVCARVHAFMRADVGSCVVQRNFSVLP
jgi:hypothetical protein